MKVLILLIALLALVSASFPSHIADRLKRNSVTIPVENSDAPQNVGDVECELCQWIVGKVEGYLAKNQTVSQIVSNLAKDCNDLPVTAWRGECTTLVQTYAPMIVQYLLNKENPNTVCTQLQLCTSQEFPINLKKLNPQMRERILKKFKVNA